jgi:hypothetical protein
MFLIKTKSEKRLNKDEIKQCTIRMLTEDFPFKTFLTSFVINYILGISALTIGILVETNKAPFYYIRTGYIVIFFRIKF